MSDPKFAAAPEDEKKVFERERERERFLNTDLMKNCKNLCISFFFELSKLKKFPGCALIDIQSFSALIQRFLRFQRCSELNQPTLILTSLVITDSALNITGKQQTDKKP